MELIKSGTNIDFIGKRLFAYLISTILIVISVGALVLRGGPNYGIDFAGGSLIQVKFAKEVNIEEIGEALNAVGLSDAVVQNFTGGEENEFIIRVVSSDQDITILSEDVRQALIDHFGFGM